jgi:hypothetical protein
MDEKTLAEIEARADLPCRESGCSCVRTDILNLVTEIRRLRDIILDVAAAPRGSQSDPRWPYLQGLSWSVIPSEFMDKLDAALVSPTDFKRYHEQAERGLTDG